MKIEIQYNLNLNDVEAWYSYCRRFQSSRDKPSIVARMIFVAVGVIWVFVVLDMWFSGLILPACIIIATFVAASIYARVWGSKSMIKKRIRKDAQRNYGSGPNDIIGDHKFLISPQGIESIGDLYQSTLQWGLIEEVVATDNHVFLTMVRGLKAYIIPKTAFSDDASKRQFVGLAGEYCKGAKTKESIAK